ncbi:uncharacterized protein LOC142329838 [Lycorma delicatula]|uniref:uncharacterized protein LOC142329838 n=1 Tax=Lycorma delicatula TaxID=130591 RepID=UPI003F5122EE
MTFLKVQLKAIVIFIILNKTVAKSTDLQFSKELINDQRLKNQKNYGDNELYEKTEECTTKNKCFITGLFNFVKKTLFILHKFIFYGIDKRDILSSEDKSKDYRYDSGNTNNTNKQLGRRSTWSNVRRKNYSERMIKRRERVKRELSDDKFKATDEEALLEEIWEKEKKKSKIREEFLKKGLQPPESSESEEESSSQTEASEKEESFHRSDWTESLPRISKYEFNTKERGDPNTDDRWWTELDRSKIRRQSNILKVPSM